MPTDEPFDQGTALPQLGSRLEPPILNWCRAARIGDAIDFAECLVKTGASCPHCLVFNTFLYCVHPQREQIIARTLATEPPPGG
jgi:hypothetical protein